ncbi:MAG: SRPBCC family protein [Anaerovoracaceae bacterium]
MIVSSIKTVFQSDIKKVWDTVLFVENYSWRSDLSRTEVLNEKQFIEYTKDGYTTVFSVTVTEPYKQWEFNMENKNMRGHWVGIFTQKGAKTEVEFTECITAKKIFLKPFVKIYLKKQQSRFIEDLKKELLR